MDPDSEDATYPICSGGAGEWSLKVLHGPDGERSFGGQAFRFVIAGEDLDFSMPPVVIPEVFETTDLSTANGATVVNIDGVLSINLDPTEVVEPGFAALTWLGGVQVGAEHLRMNQIEGQDVLAAWTSRNYEGRAEYYDTLEPGVSLDTRTAVGREWLVRAAEDDHEIGGATIEDRHVIGTIGPDSVTLRRVAPRSPKPVDEPAEPEPAALPTTLSDEAMKPARAKAEAAVRRCRERHATLASEVQVAFVVAPDGTVSEAHTKWALEGTLLGECAQQAVEAQTFPKSETGVSKTWDLLLR